MPAREYRRVIALMTSWIFVACTMLGLAHAAQVAHISTPSKGESRHAPHIACTGHATTHVHSLPSDDDDDTDICEVPAATHPLAESPTPPPAIDAPQPDPAPLSRAALTNHAPAPLLRFAPKTSPPYAS